MKLAHYRMLEAFEQADAEGAAQILQEYFGLNIRDLSIEIHPTSFHGNKIHIWDGPGYYTWSPTTGFCKSSSKFDRRTSCAITLKV